MKESFVITSYVEREDGSAVSFCTFMLFPNYEEARLFVESQPQETTKSGDPVRYLIETVVHYRALSAEV